MEDSVIKKKVMKCTDFCLNEMNSLEDEEKLHILLSVSGNLVTSLLCQVPKDVSKKIMIDFSKACLEKAEELKNCFG